MLIVPGQLARIRTQGDRGIGVETIVGGDAGGTLSRLEQRRGGVGVGDSEVHEIELGIVAARRPHAAAESLFQRGAVPRVTARFAGARDRVEAPRLFSGLGVETDDVAAASALYAETH